MLESILQKILVNNAGKYIDGIDKEKLKVSLWSGSITIKGISIKKEVIKMLNMPVNMKFSHLGELKLDIPFKNLGSKPVEASLTNVFIILEPADKDTWEVSDYAKIQSRINLMELYIAEYLAKIMEARKQLEGKDQEEDKGMVGRLTEKVIDNIQVRHGWG